MEAQKLIRLSGMVLLALAVSIGTLAVIYILQNPQLMTNIASIGWNGMLVS